MCKTAVIAIEAAVFDERLEMDAAQARLRSEVDETVNEEARAYWDRRARTFGRSRGRNDYVDEFVKRLALRGDETLLDMGCATGTLALPLARRGHTVFACDFSPNMIDCLKQRAAEEGLPVATRLMAWQDDWETAGFGSNCVDVAFASRSIPAGGRDGALSLAIGKLDTVARRRAALTTAAGILPLYEPRLMKHLGRAVPVLHTDEEATSLLKSRGRCPELSYIICPRPMRFDSLEEGTDELRRMAGRKPLDSVETKLFEDYVRDHFKTLEEDGGVFYQLDYPLSVRWTFIAWDIEEK